jgi:hypothetical protein
MTTVTCTESGIEFPSKDGWQKCSERIPPFGKSVIAYNGSEVDTCIFIHENDDQFRLDYPRITHWMSMPLPPEAE